jgi:hypothetical protein
LVGDEQAPAPPTFPQAVFLTSPVMKAIPVLRSG